ncbi:hypothetical protein LUZ60_007228 [Juncus effusus]|nr:hypothetical protein LUZ60_007228 [Juncus effusus]
MSITVKGKSCVPPGFRFHPTEEELLNYYLRKKVASERIDLDVIRDVDLNKLEPWDIQEKCKIGSTPQNEWYFFSHKDKKYPTGTRTNRATTAGFWKATGRDKVIHTSFKRIGMRKTLVFYKGRAPHGQKSDWIMHEYRLDENSDTNLQSIISNTIGEATQEEGWVVCRVFKKKTHLQKSMDSPKNSFSNSTSIFDVKNQIRNVSSDETLDQILQFMSRSCKEERETTNNTKFHHPFEPLFNTGTAPSLPSVPTDCPTLDICQMISQPSDGSKRVDYFEDAGFGFGSSVKLIESTGQDCGNGYTGGDGDLWSFTKCCASPSIFGDHIGLFF